MSLLTPDFGLFFCAACESTAIKAAFTSCTCASVCRAFDRLPGKSRLPVSPGTAVKMRLEAESGRKSVCEGEGN